ncbi:MAG: hypothetical protein ACTSU2_15010, partial [Promethearchaeota archaeon]
DKEKEINITNNDQVQKQENARIINQNVMGNNFLLNLLIGTALIRTLFLVIFFLPLSYELLYELNALQWFAGFMLGTLSGGVAFSLYNFGLIKDKQGDVIILSYIEPVVATIINICFLGGISYLVIVGGVIVLLSNLIIILKNQAKTTYRTSVLNKKIKK